MLRQPPLAPRKKWNSKNQLACFAQVAEPGHDVSMILDDAGRLLVREDLAPGPHLSLPEKPSPRSDLLGKPLLLLLPLQLLERAERYGANDSLGILGQAGKSRGRCERLDRSGLHIFVAQYQK